MMDEWKEGTRPFLLFGALETCCFLKSVVLAWSQRMFFIHIIILALWVIGMHAKWEGKVSPMRVFTSRCVKVKKPQLGALQQSCFETCGFLSVQLVSKMKMMILICWPNHLAKTSVCLYPARSLLSVCGGGKNLPMCCAETLVLRQETWQSSMY